MATMTQAELVEHFEPTGRYTPDGAEVWEPRTRDLDCEGCGVWLPEDEIDLCELDGATVCDGCHAGCNCR